MVLDVTRGGDCKPASIAFKGLDLQANVVPRDGDEVLRESSRQRLKRGAKKFLALRAPHVDNLSGS
jgi:hypothetical protein